MDPTTALGAILAAFGLSGAAGLNAWIPLFGAGLLTRLDVIELADSYDQLGSTVVLAITGLALVVDLVADKIPGLDHVMHAIGVVIHPIAGALVFAGQAGVGSDLPAIASLILGAAVAGGLHGARASVRPAVTAGTAGVGNPVVSALEDGVAVLLTVLAVLLPVVAVALLAGIVVLIVRARRRIRRDPTPPAPSRPGR